MKCVITNKSELDIEELSPLIDDLASHIQNVTKIKSMPAITLQDDAENANVLLGKTAHYDPQNKVIAVYVTNRHPKDIMRSIAHEFIHHAQNERGEFDNMSNTDAGYAQSDKHLRNMEKEAYLKGNMCFRDWEDGYKRQMMESIHRQNSFKRRNSKMKIHNWKNNELNKLLMEKFNLGSETIDESNCAGNRSKKKGEPCPECGKVNCPSGKSLKEEEQVEEGEVNEDIGKKSVEMGADDNPEETKMDHLPDEVLKNIAKKKGKKKKQEESFRREIRAMIEEIMKLK